MSSPPESCGDLSKTSGTDAFSQYGRGMSRSEGKESLRHPSAKLFPTTSVWFKCCCLNGFFSGKTEAKSSFIPSEQCSVSSPLCYREEPILCRWPCREQAAAPRERQILSRELKRTPLHLKRLQVLCRCIIQTSYRHTHNIGAFVESINAHESRQHSANCAIKEKHRSTRLDSARWFSLGNLGTMQQGRQEEEEEASSDSYLGQQSGFCPQSIYDQPLQLYPCAAQCGRADELCHDVDGCGSKQHIVQSDMCGRFRDRPDTIS
ncbi:uncharacterized protein V6R79_006189 [Siganus canaliculatus]